VALAMTYAGSRGETESEIKKVLHFDLPQPELHSAFNATLMTLAGRANELQAGSTGNGFNLRIVNQAWGQNGYPFLSSYLDVLAQNYGAGLFTVDFAKAEATRLLINGWVEEQTETRIKDLLPLGSLTSDSRLVLTNAIYFKASWLAKFEPSLTQDATFHAPDGPRTVSMMHRTLEAAYGEGENYQALELPYVSPSVGMLLVLPADGMFDAIVGGLDEAFFQGVRSSLSEHAVIVSLPKFQFETKAALSGTLIDLGMPSAFGAADFSGIAGGTEPLQISEVYHNSFVAIDEQGTEAAAATAVVIGTVSVLPSAAISFDRPFVFAIYDKPTGQVLFIGHLRDPG
jgi:serpin B